VRYGPLIGTEAVLKRRRRGIVDPVSLASPSPGQGLAINTGILAVQSVPKVNVSINDHRLTPRLQILDNIEYITSR
jgi:hypothetical protein